MVTMRPRHILPESSQAEEIQKFIHSAALFIQCFLLLCNDANLVTNKQKRHLNMFSKCSFVSADEVTSANAVNNNMTIRQPSSCLKTEPSAEQSALPGHSERLPSGSEKPPLILQFQMTRDNQLIKMSPFATTDTLLPSPHLNNKSAEE